MPYKIGVAIHLEPDRPIELPHLLDGLNSVGDEYQKYSRMILGITDKTASKLYVGSVKPGSIDIFLQPELIESVKAGLAIATSAGPVDAANALLDFTKRLGSLLDLFKAKPNPEDITIRECDNAINISRNVVEAGGQLTLNFVNIDGDSEQTHRLGGPEARRVFTNASEARAILKLPSAERKNSVAMVWKTFDKSHARIEGQRSPDKGIIEEIDPLPKAILFVDDEAGLKADILASEENPMLVVYYVDVEIIRIDGKIKAYRIAEYHGKELLDGEA